MDITSIEDSIVDDRTKGIPGGTAPFKLKEISSHNWNALREDLPFPLMVLKQDALAHNSLAFKDYIKTQSVSLAPHGKTTMCPQIFKQQLEDGSWALTAATVNQIQVYRRYGVSRIIMANQLLGRQHIRYVVDQINSDEKFEFYCLVDSKEQFAKLTDELAEYPPNHPIRVLIELGELGGRTGARDQAEAESIAAMIEHSPHVVFAGVEGFEGVLKTNEAVEAFLTRMKSLLESLDPRVYADLDEVIITAGGSAYFDIVVKVFKTVSIEKPVRIVIRSGCYITHDSGVYNRFLDDAHTTDRKLNVPLKPALEVMSYVQSLPETGLAILTMGKRDCPYDAGLPRLTRVYRPGKGFIDVDPELFTINSVNDQHAFLSFEGDSGLKVGDIVCCGISHPCTAFDKWAFMPVVDDEYNVVSGIRTFF